MSTLEIDGRFQQPTVSCSPAPRDSYYPRDQSQDAFTAYSSMPPPPPRLQYQEPPVPQSVSSGPLPAYGDIYPREIPPATTQHTNTIATYGNIPHREPHTPVTHPSTTVPAYADASREPAPVMAPATTLPTYGEAPARQAPPVIHPANSVPSFGEIPSREVPPAMHPVSSTRRRFHPYAPMSTPARGRRNSRVNTETPSPNHAPPPYVAAARYGFDMTGQIAPPGIIPKVTATLWEEENCMCFQVEARGVCVARRQDNNMVNGTKLLNVTGMTRGRRDGILKSEKCRQVVKVGPMHLKGVWIPFDRALYFANKEKITESLYPLFLHNLDDILYLPPSQDYGQALLAAAEKKREKEQGNMRNSQYNPPSLLPPIGALPPPTLPSQSLLPLPS